MSKFFDISNGETEFVILEQCDSAEKNRIFKDTMNKYHSYMKYKDTCNRRINWNVYEASSGNLIGAVGINSAILAMAPRDEFIGWNGNKKLRLAGLNKLANNYRFCLIKENITEKNIGTKVLKRLRQISPVTWKQRYGDELVLLETLVKPPWSGSVYLADNWLQIGSTKGYSLSKAPLKLWQKEDSARGELARKDPKAAAEKYAVGNKMYDVKKSEPKIIFVKPLVKNWKEILLGG